MSRGRFSEAKMPDGPGSSGNVAAVKRLLGQGISPETSITDEKPLYIACAHGSLEVATLLLEARAHIDCLTRSHATPLYIATQLGHVELVSLLLKRKADPNLGMYGEITPLMLAARSGAKEVVQLLLESGSNRALKSEGKTAQQWAGLEGHNDVANLIETYVPLSNKQKLAREQEKARKELEEKEKEKKKAKTQAEAKPPKAKKSVATSIWDSPEHSDDAERSNDNHRGVFAVMSPVHSSPSRSRSLSPLARKHTTAAASASPTSPSPDHLPRSSHLAGRRHFQRPRSLSPAHSPSTRRDSSPSRSNSPLRSSSFSARPHSPPSSPSHRHHSRQSSPQRRSPSRHSPQRRSRSRSPRGFNKSLVSYIPPTQYRAFAAAANGQDETDKLSHNNLGHKMLQKMGWQEGRGLGRSEDGMLAPIAAKAKVVPKSGIGSHVGSVVTAEDDNFTKYKKMMMLAYKHRSQTRRGGEAH